MSSCSAAAVAAGGQQQQVRAARGGLPRPRRPSRPAAGSPGQRPAAGSDASWGRAGYSWWGGGAGAQLPPAPRRQSCRAGLVGRPPARVPTGNRELVRRALSPPATGVRGAALRRWSFRPTPSRLRNASCLASPASPRPS
ncbi:circumsporozoite protein-like [Lolium rigidum]|uniref:circumsporozoite protein-like n=1 Tax=Lolium rigidum TaxID=89674 RepID=UPI001F5C9B0D|nr:circumsporozoite protein-like [Lolium rigidum]